MKRVLIGIAALVVAVGFAATRFTSLQGRAPGVSKAGYTAPDFKGIATWINSPPLKLSELRGKVVWIDFWTYSCINCIRTLPAVRAFYARYHPLGLETIGVHSPEFDFEKVEGNVRAAVMKYKIPYPVAMDSDMATWRAYDNSYWPRVYLIDAKGRVRYDHAGEGGEDDIERNLRSLLAETGAKLPAALDLTENPSRVKITPEIYAGYERGSVQGALRNLEGYGPQVITDYARVSQQTISRAGTDGGFFLEGKWQTQDEYLEASEDGARVILPFFARNVYVVAAPASGTARASVLRGTARIKELTVNADDLYTVLLQPSAERGVLTLSVSRGFRLYTFTFG